MGQSTMIFLFIMMFCTVSVSCDSEQYSYGHHFAQRIIDSLSDAYKNIIIFLISVFDFYIKPMLPLTLNWATASLNTEDCSTYTVSIRYHCVNQEFKNETELLKYQELCDELIPMGLKKHIERDNLEINGKIYKLRIKDDKTDDDAGNSQKIVVVNDCSVRSNNYLYKPVEMGYCFHRDVDKQWEEDLYFMETITHELGHHILFVGEGIYESLIHKGTSSFWQTVLDDGPVTNCTTVEELDIMFYYRAYESSCFVNRSAMGTPGRFFNHLEKKMLSRRDAAHLVTKALQEPLPHSCRLL